MHLTVSRGPRSNVDLRTFYNHDTVLDSCAIIGQFVFHCQVSGRSRPFSVMISAANVISNVQFACLLSWFLSIQLRVRPLGQRPHMARLCAATVRCTRASPERLHCALRCGFCAFQQRPRGVGSLRLRPAPAGYGKCRSQGPRLLPTGSAFSGVTSPRSFSCAHCAKAYSLLGRRAWLV